VLVRREFQFANRTRYDSGRYHCGEHSLFGDATFEGADIYDAPIFGALVLAHAVRDELSDRLRAAAACAPQSGVAAMRRVILQ